MTSSFDQSAALWCGTMQPVLAASEDPEDRKIAYLLLKEREMFKGELPVFMLGFHQMHDHMRANGIRMPLRDTPTPKQTPIVTKAKKPVTKAKPKSVDDGKGGEVSRRPQLRELHETVRGLLAPYKVRVDHAPRAPKRIGNEVHYYLDYSDKLARSTFDDMEETLSAGLYAFFGQSIKKSQVGRGNSGWPFKVSVEIDPRSPLLKTGTNGKERQ